MKTYKSAKDVKKALLQGKEVVINKWSALINAKDEVEIWDPKGEGVVASLMHLDKACQDFVKYAQGIPETMPKPVTYPATPSGSGPLGPDTSQDKPWTDPKVDQTPVMQGPTSDPDLKDDTSQDPPWTDPAINTRPQPNIERGGLPDTDLGKDTQKNPVEWEDKLTGPGSQQGQFESGSNKAAQERSLEEDVASDKLQNWLDMELEKSAEEGANLLYSMFGEDYGEAFKSDPEAFENEVKKEIESALDQLGEALSIEHDKELPWKTENVLIGKALDAFSSHFTSQYDFGISHEQIFESFKAAYDSIWNDIMDVLEGPVGPPPGVYGSHKRSQDMDPGDSGKEEMGKSPEWFKRIEDFDLDVPEDYDGPVFVVGVGEDSGFDEIFAYMSTNSDHALEKALSAWEEMALKEFDIYVWDDIAEEMSGATDEEIQEAYLTEMTQGWMYYEEEFASYDEAASALQNQNVYGSHKRSQDMDPGDSGKEEMGTSDPDTEYYPELEYEPHQIENKGETPSRLPEDLGGRNNAFVDTFDKEAEAGPSYQDLVNASPSRDLLTDIADPERWATGQALGSFATGLGRGLFRDDDDCRDEANKGMDNMRGNPPGEAEAGCDYPKKDKKSRRRAQWWDEQTAAVYDSILQTPNLQYELIQQMQADPYNAASILQQAVSSSLGEVEADWQALSDQLFSDNESAAYGEAAANPYHTQDDQVGMPTTPTNFLENPVDWITEKGKGIYNEMTSSERKVSRRRQAGPRLKENWGGDGAYSRDLEAESAEELYHLTRSFGQEDDYDWSSMRPAPAEAMESDPEAMPLEARKAVDEEAKSYWTDYFEDYGEKLVQDDSTKKNRGEYEPKVDETPEPAGQQSVKSRRRVRRGQAAPAQPPENAPPGGMPAAPDTAPQQVPAAPGAQPPAGKAPKAPGAGDEGLRALGWTDQDIKAMDEESKQKILQVQLKKPGAGAPAAGAPTGAPGTAKPPAKPAPQVPQSGPAPMPAAPEQGLPQPTARRVKREQKEHLQKSRAFRMLTGQVPAEQALPPAPNTSPSQPVQTGPQTTPSAPAGKVDEFQGEVAEELSPEAQAMSIYNEVLQSTVQASSPEQVPALKAQTLIQRLLVEAGMPVQEARSLFGLKSGDGFNKLFQ